jgi:lysine 2,3-aminomutase
MSISHETAQVCPGTAAAGAQPYIYRRVELREPDWTRFPGWRSVTAAEWADAQWQRAHCVKSIAQLQAVLGDLLDESCYADLAQDAATHATMPMLLPPQMLNTIAAGAPVGSTGSLAAAFRGDPIRRYMLPMASDRDLEWPGHPFASRDSLHESQMWAVEGLTHRYPTKVLAELTNTCPQYCGHCTRMDLVGTSTPAVEKHRFLLRPADRHDAMLAYLRRTPGVRDVVVSGGDVANVPWPRLEAFVCALLEMENIRDIRLASKALIALPQHWLQDEVRAGVERLARTARARGVGLAVHTHTNSAASVTPLVARAAGALLDAGVRDVRNQGVLLRGVNDSVQELLDLCFALLDGAAILPYYFYQCDLIPGSEHWRVSLAQAQELQHGIMGYLPGFATPRLVVDVPFVGKRWVDQAVEYDRVLGISQWTKNYRTALEVDDPEALARKYPYYDPIRTLPAEGQAWWRRRQLPVARGA